MSQYNYMHINFTNMFYHLSKNPLETANLAFSGTLCKEGYGRGMVIRIGASTVMGQIADIAVKGEKQKTPLRRELDRFVLIMSCIAIGFGILFFLLSRFVLKYNWVDCILIGVGIEVANVPEGILGGITICLYLIAKKLHSKNVLVKNLESVETLGSTSCICTDKTGTLTQNKMTVENLWYDGKLRKGQNYQKFGPEHIYDYSLSDSSFKVLHNSAIVSSAATFNIDKDKRTKNVVWLEAPVNGDASETAIVRFF